MAQVVKIIDLSKSYIPGDPNAFPNNLEFTAQEDSPEKANPIMPYEGYNFLPTSYGYRSYFGTTPALTLEALPKPCDEIITIQSDTYQNMLVAFCSDGIRTATAGATVWTHAIVLPDDWTISSIYRSYTWTVIENNLYIYRQGYAKVIKISSALVVTEFTPSFLNMAGQMGIFRGNGRLCFWDSANSVAWSSAFDLTDFTPSIENMVGNSVFLGVQGRIVTILPHGDGFIIYSTRSIVGVTYTSSGSLVWDAKTITSSGGITHPKAACLGQNNQEHFAYTTLGIVSIGHFNALSTQYDMKVILPELFDYLKESRSPVYLQCHAARFLYFSVIEDNYINGITSFTNVEIPSLRGPILNLDTSTWNTLSNNPYLSPKETYHVIDSFLADATTLAAPNRTADSYTTSRWVAVMVVPNYRNKAYDKGLLTGDGAVYKSTEVEFLAQASAEDYFEYGDGLNNYYNESTNNYRNWTIDVLSGLLQNTKDILPDSLSTNSTVERSFYKNLYSQELKGLETGGVSAVDLFYNFMYSVNEFRAFAKANYTKLIAEILDINGKEHIRSVYSWQPVPADNTQPSTITRIPTEVGQVCFDLRKGSAGVSGILDINYVVTKYKKIQDAGSVRTKISESMIEAADSPYYYMFVFNPGAISTTKEWSYPPSVEEIVAFFSNPANINPQADGTIYTLFYDQTYTTPSGFSYVHYVSHVNCLVKNNTSGAISVASNLMYVKTRYQDSIDLTGTSLGYSHSIPTTWNNVTAELNKFLYMYNLGYKNVSSLHTIMNMTSNGILTSSVQAKFMEIDQYFRKTSHNTIQSYPENNTVTVSPLPLTLERMGTTNIWLIKATITVPGKNGGNPFVDVIAFFYPLYIYEAKFKETPLFAITDETYSGAQNWDSSTRTALQLLFTETDRDTIIKDSVGIHRVSSNTNLFTPSVVDNGATNQLTFLPANNYHNRYPMNSMIYNVGNCIPFEFYKDAVLTKIVHGIDPTNIHKGKLLNVAMPVGPVPELPENYVCYGYNGDWDGFVTIDLTNYTYPGATYTLQDGSPIPGYPTLVGSFVMDMHLKKWGKQAASFKALLQFSPINATNNEAISYTNFGMDSGILDASDMKIKLFDVNPQAGFIRYGKIGYYRLGFTNALEIFFNFRTPFTGKIVLDGSVNNRDLEIGIQHSEDFTNVRSCIVNCDIEARWHTISIHGKFDLQYIEFRGKMSSRR